MAGLTNIQITQLGVTFPTVQVKIHFEITGLLPDRVEIYAPRVAEDTGNLAVSTGPIDTIDMAAPENSYDDIVNLEAGTPFNIYLCPRSNDERLGDYWEVYCEKQQFTTRAPSTTPQPTKTAPVITQLIPRTATIHRPPSILVEWKTPTTHYDKWHLMWKDAADPDQLQNWASVELKTASTTSFSYRVTPIISRRKYSFKVQGCISHIFTADACSDFSPTVDIEMRNTSSLREWLDGATLSSGIRSLGLPVYGAGFRAMMGL